MTDVVASREEAARLEPAPVIIVDALVEFLDERGLGEGPVTVRRIGEGHSNLTFALRRGELRLVLRRGPRPPVARSTHDMLREARTQLALREHGVPVPEIVAVCEDDSVLGVPFYLMREVEGDVITSGLPRRLATAADRAALAYAAVDLLAGLHKVPVGAPTVAALGRPEGYLDRQLAVFDRLWRSSAGRDIPLFDDVTELLTRNRPDSTLASVVHGDFRLGNIMFARSAPGAVAALLDWEMSTLGDPLADLGYFLATYSEPGASPSVMELSFVTARPGFPDRERLARRYAERTGADLAALPWYEALALWKSAVFCEEIHQRWRRGEHGEGDRFARSLEAGVPDLLSRARRLL